MADAPLLDSGDLARMSESWPRFRKTATTPMVKVTGPCRVDTGHGIAELEAGDWLAVDASGQPYPIRAAEHAMIYEPDKPTVRFDQLDPLTGAWTPSGRLDP